MPTDPHVLSLAARTTVVVCAFADERRDLTLRCVGAVLGDHPAPLEVLVVVDHNPALFDDLRIRLPPTVRIVENPDERGLSSARNTAIDQAQGAVVAFLDDDACPRPGWLAHMLTGFSDPNVIAVGGEAVPDWEGSRPNWFPASFLWVVGCSYAGQSAHGPVRNPIGANMAFRREVFARAGLFSTNIGRLGSLPLGCEETELCIRAARRIPGAQIVLVSEAPVDHWVPLGRQTFGYLVRRCYYEGVSKALVRTLGDTRTLETERAYVTRTLPSEVTRALTQALAGPERTAATRRIAAVAAGLSAACIGYARGAILFRSRGTADPQDSLTGADRASG